MSYPISDLVPSPQPPVRPRRWPLVLGVVSGAAIVAVILVLAPWDPTRSQWISDQYTVLTEPSPADVVAIADATGMSDDGRLIFLASTPAIEDADTFNEDCNVESEGTLGCYDGHDIFIFAVTDPRLQGTIEVTGAHEMLHAAYQRLTNDERAKVDTMVDQAVAALPADDPVFLDMAAYPKDQWPDEWHSRLGTEFADLPPALETYYARYFDDRGLVLDLDEKSTALLDQYEQQLSDLSGQVDTLDTQITAAQADYDAALASYNADVAAFNVRADAGDFPSQQEFDDARAALVARRAALDTQRTALTAQIDQYNALLDQLTALDADYADLYHGLDSTSPPPDSVG